ncbi:MAG TPA: dipeptide epimerase [Longimicrobiales bacterium]|nr:dipeptide epimerase [Longimicrobiales bacterium]
MRLDFEILPLQTRHEFHIARAAAPAQRRNVWIRLEDETGAFGWGEAAPNAFYAETADTVAQVLPVYADVLRKADVTDIAGIENDLHDAAPSLHPYYPPHPSARAGISAALLDLLARKAGIPAWQYLALQPKSPVSSFTIGIDDLEVMREKTRAAHSYQILKVKVGTPDDERILAMLREEAPHARIRVDANTAWNAAQTIEYLPMLQEYGVELIEQPVAADDYEGLRAVKEASRIPIIADESCRVADDVEQLDGCVDGVNIKLAKCGSMWEALRIAEAARARGMKVMLGCMIESTLGIAAAIQLCSLMDYVDLDGAALLRDDPFMGPGIDDAGNIRFNHGAGLGVTQR